MFKRSIFLLFLVLTLNLSLAIPFVNANAGTNVLECTMDCYIESGSQANTVHDIQSYVGQGTPSNTLYGLYYFNLTELQDAYDYGYYPETNVHVRFYYRYMSSGMDGQNITWTFRYIESAWDSSTVTWNTAPDVSEVIQTIYNVKTDDWDVKEFGYFDLHDMFEAVLNGTQTDYYGIQVFVIDDLDSNEFVEVDTHDAGTYSPSVFFNYDEDEEEGGSGSTDNYAEISEFLIIFVVLFLPAIALGGGMAANKETASLAPMGFIAGLVIGVVMGVIVGIVPTWAVIFVGMGVILLLWSANR